jgi:hypothetical protein
MSTRTVLAAALCLAVGAAASATPRPFAPGDDAAVIAEWSQLLQTNIPSNAGLTTPRYYALLHVAMFDAVNAIEREYGPYHARLIAPYGASSAAAAAQAGHDVLVALLPPAAQPALDAALEARLATLQPWRAALGAAVGRAAAKDILAWREHDGYAAPPPVYAQPALPGVWQPTPPAFQAPQFLHFGDALPFGLLTSTQYLPDPPPALTSARWAAELEEVKALGSATSTVRTAEQTETARLFAPVGYSTVHFAMWNNVARDVAQNAHWSLVDTARLFAIVNTSIHDGLQTSHTSKYIYNFWRPITAIRRADEDLNPDTTADPTWTPLLTTPAYPSHSSNQTCVGTSAARALARAFGKDAVPFTVTWVGTGGNPNVTRSYAGFWQLAEQQARSRLYGGIHYTFELTTSQESCVKVADYLADNYMLPRHGHWDWDR